MQNSPFLRLTASSLAVVVTIARAQYTHQQSDDQAKLTSNMEKMCQQRATNLGTSYLLSL